jgi:hypothetical protein
MPLTLLGFHLQGVCATKSCTPLEADCPLAVTAELSSLLRRNRRQPSRSATGLWSPCHVERGSRNSHILHPPGVRPLQSTHTTYSLSGSRPICPPALKTEMLLNGRNHKSPFSIPHHRAFSRKSLDRSLSRPVDSHGVCSLTTLLAAKKSTGLGLIDSPQRIACLTAAHPLP